MNHDEWIQQPCYIVLDIPSPMAEKIRELRQHFDADRANLPAEITVTGSCGVGLVEQGQSLAFVLDEIRNIASKLKPFCAAFDHVERFSNTDIYYLTLKDPTPFVKINKLFAESRIHFLPNNFPYMPHCTLKLRSTPTEQELFELFFLNAPEEEFQIDTFSVYALQDVSHCDLIAKVEIPH